MRPIHPLIPGKVVNESSVFDKFKKGADVHYYKEAEQKVLGETVADKIKQALKN